MVFDIQTIAAFLLIGRIVSIIFISIVLFLQIRLFRTEIDFTMVPNLSNYQKKNIYRLRRVLFMLSVFIFIGNIIPIIIDIITLFDTKNALGRNQSVPTISVAYALSNSITAAVSSIMIWTLYKIAGLTSVGKK